MLQSRSIRTTFKHHVALALAIWGVCHVSSPALAQRNKIILDGAESMKSLKRDGESLVRYIGNVRFKYNDTRVTCDSAYYSSKSNWFEAFSNVVVSQGTTRIYGDNLHFNGNTSRGKFRGKEVKLVDGDATLVTRFLDFDSKANSANYYNGGTLTTKDSKLNCQRGYYFKTKRRFTFAGDVELEGTDGKLLTDSLEYNAEAEVANFFGPTHIYNDDSYVYCEKGWHNRKLKQSNFAQNAYMVNGPQKIFGQNIYYDKQQGYARAIGKVIIIDTVQRTNVYGEKANYWEKNKEAEVTENPYLILFDDTDTLFMRSKTMFVKSIPLKNWPDSSYRLLKAIGEVKFYRRDVQGLCDSLYYNTFDSTLSMYVNPIIWNDNSQISADFIKAFTSKNKIRRMNFDGSAFICSKEEENRFNQVKGKNIVAHFANGKLSRMDVSGNGQTIYHVRDKGEISAINKAESSDLTIFLKDNKVSRILFLKKPVATLYPINKVEKEDVTLKGFSWKDDLRPTSRYSIIPKKLKLKPQPKGHYEPQRENKKEA